MPNEFTSDVSSVHWNSAGTRLITSSSDMVARVWEIQSDGEVEIKNVKGFKVSLMNSKFNE
jgi:WD40 repeat protein